MAQSGDWLLFGRLAILDCAIIQNSGVALHNKSYKSDEKPPQALKCAFELLLPRILLNNFPRDKIIPSKFFDPRITRKQH